MGRTNFLPASFAKLNKHQQPIIPNILLLVVSIVFLVLQNAGTFMNDFFNLMAFGCACAYALTMISAIRMHKQHPDWKSGYHLKGGNFTRYLALVISVVIAFFCTLGQGVGSWISFAVYMGIYLGQAKMVERAMQRYYIELPDEMPEQYLRASLLVPTLLHGFWDFSLSVGGGLMTALFYLFVLAFFVDAYRKLRFAAGSDERL